MVYLLGARLVDFGLKIGIWENDVVLFFDLWRNIGVEREQIPRMRYMFHEYQSIDLTKKIEVNIYSHQSKCMCVGVN